MESTSTVASFIDPKGSIVLEVFPAHNETDLPTALVLRPAAHEYVVAHDYDRTTGEWSHGTYYGRDLGKAYEHANPEILEDATIRWQIEDVRAALDDKGVPTTRSNVHNLGVRMANLRERFVEEGNETLEIFASELRDELD